MGHVVGSKVGFDSHFSQFLATKKPILISLAVFL